MDNKEWINKTETDTPAIKEQGLTDFDWFCRTAKERQQYLEWLCAMDEQEFQRLWEQSDVYAELRRHYMESEHPPKIIAENTQTALTVTLEEREKIKREAMKEIFDKVENLCVTSGFYLICTIGDFAKLRKQFLQEREA